MTEWRDVLGYEGYYRVSDEGEVYGVKRGKVLSASVNRYGYRQVNLFRPGMTRKTVTVHKAEKEAFEGREAPEGVCVCHNNGQSLDNRLSNLRFGTLSSNMLDKGLHGTDWQRAKTHCPRGHLLSTPNLVSWDLQRGLRKCRACSNARCSRYDGKPGTLQDLSDRHYQRIMDGVTNGPAS